MVCALNLVSGDAPKKVLEIGVKTPNLVVKFPHNDIKMAAK